jgi:hypothetical protein
MGTGHRSTDDRKQGGEHRKGLSRLQIGIIDVEPVTPVLDAQAAD